MPYTTPAKKHHTVNEQADRLPTYLAEYYKERTLDRITIDGQTIQGYFEYSFINEKTYVKSPERSADGSIPDLDTYAWFLTPRIVIKYKYMHISDYRNLMRLLQSKNEFVVECYDIVLDKRVTHNMYFAPPEMPAIHQRYLEVLGVKDYTVELIGTNTDVEKYSVRFNLNIPSDAKNDWATQVGEGENTHYIVKEADANITLQLDAQYKNGQKNEKGEDILVPITDITFNNKYKFKYWCEDYTGASGFLYLNKNAYLFQDNTVLFAIWEKGATK